MAPEAYRTLIKASYDSTMSMVLTLNGIHVSSPKIWLGVLNVQMFHHQVRLVKMWKICIKLILRSAYIWWCLQHS